MLCKTHSLRYKDKWNVESEECINCINFPNRDFQLIQGKLPIKSQVISYVLSCRQNDCGHKDSTFENVALDIMLQWIFCNVYPQSYKTVKKKVYDLLQEYHKIKDYIKSKRKDTYWTGCHKFIRSCQTLFDIISDPSYIRHKNGYGVLK